MAAVTESTRDALAGLSVGKPEVLKDVIGSPEDHPGATGLDERTFALVKLATLIALDAPPSSYACHVASAVEAGASSEQILGVLYAVGPQVGGPRVVAAAPELMLALGIALPDSADYPENGD
jgi:alkylhydroperoxidase/carboxymuconolactone decarboxylase family protein YurZ